MKLDALSEYYLRVADASRIPVLVYSVPIFTHLHVEAPLIAARRAASQHHRHERQLRRRRRRPQNHRRRAQIISNSRRLRRPRFSNPSKLGACGAILALANPFPELCVEIYEASRSGDSKNAHSLAQQLLAPAKMLGPQYGIPGLKYALDRLGYHGGPPRPPLLPLSEAAKTEIDAMLSNLTAHSAHL